MEGGYACRFGACALALVLSACVPEDAKVQFDLPTKGSLFIEGLDAQIPISGICSHKGVLLFYLDGQAKAESRCQDGKFSMDLSVGSLTKGPHQIQFRYITSNKVSQSDPRTEERLIFKQDARVAEPKELSFIGNNPVQTIEDKTELDPEALLKLSQDFQMNHFNYSFYNKGADRKIFIRGLENLVEESLSKGDHFSDLKLMVDDSLGRPVPSGDIQPLKTPENGMNFQDRYGRLAKDKSDFKKIAQAEALEMLRKIALLSQRNPRLIQGIHEDDFLANRKAATMLDREFFKSLCREARSIQPNFKFAVTVYCFPEPSADPARERKVFSSFLRSEIDYSKPTRQIHALFDYMSDEETAACVDEIAIYNQGAGASPGAMQAWKDSDLAASKECTSFAQSAFPDKKITHGVYLTAYATLSLEQRISNLEYALETGSKSLLFFYTPSKPYKSDVPFEEENNKIVADYLQKRLPVKFELAVE